MRLKGKAIPKAIPIVGKVFVVVLQEFQSASIMTDLDRLAGKHNGRSRLFVRNTDQETSNHAAEDFIVFFEMLAMLLRHVSFDLLLFDVFATLTEACHNLCSRRLEIR